MNTELALVDFALPSAQIEFSPAAIAQRESLLDECAAIGLVTNAETNERCAALALRLHKMKSRAKKAAESARAPVNALAKKIIEAEREYCASLEEEWVRLCRVSGEWTQTEERKRKAEEMARVLELQRIDKERRAAEAKIEEARRIEAAKLEEEKRRLEAEAVQANIERLAELKSLQDDLARQRSEAEAKTLDAVTATRNEAAMQAALATAKPQAELPFAVGQRGKWAWNYTITDERQLAAVLPDCVKITPKHTEILDKLMVLAGAPREGATYQIAGLTACCVWESKTALPRARKAIEV